jgi:hypothetical protein
MLSQHPDLDGIFDGADRPHFDRSGHSHGYCESQHVWGYLNPDDSVRHENGHLPYWGLPQYLQYAYRESPSGYGEICRLAWDVLRHRNADHQQPLIKDLFNTLRIGMIVRVFPSARFVLICRSWEEFSKRSISKWARVSTDQDTSRPVAGLHWSMINTIARFDLEIHAPGRYSIVWLEALQASSEEAAESLKRVTTDLGLAPHAYDLSPLAIKWAEGGSSRPQHLGLDDIPHIVSSERELLARPKVG